MQRFVKFVESMIVLVLNRYVNANEQTDDSSFVENTNKIPLNIATPDFICGQNAGRYDA